ncbi:M20/M25/M40 family metallo-hydrolase [Candidatus Chlamydia sanziniae]|uniref:Catalyzes the cleavage of p-aminobenzoyl-glutamate to p-aminobenzoate and glutamate, subunit A n=1 Tax=Candidatus Chlamydia sanziniae TaxID=1806891 RepID=A0A1A9HUU9_9CHLA|nr:M20/M25/M40 family metallo-hydrolase [Candidatus Chlamydia sanziniae]ANH78769.1 Catalyzes the cleavage of p-aminobenzoyl-glutamate to p-aminobenzoate and glutamate, subunit A [Candidatus Chlamydia sanziniae]
MSVDLDYFNTHMPYFLKEFAQFLSFPSISADPSYLSACMECANFLVTNLSDIFTVELWETPGHPSIICASYRHNDSKAPTLLLYNHYDVQPAYISDGWQQDPFILREKEGFLYARGASDNKGQCYYTLKALQYYYKSRNKFPLNVIWIIEGEEESGSPALSTWLEKKQFQADYLLIVDGGFISPEHPCVNIGARGIVSMKLYVEEGTQDMHSGNFGGVAYNANRALIEMLSSLRNPDNSVTVEHFYDDITITGIDTPDLPQSNIMEVCEKNLGFHPTGNEPQYTLEASRAFRPTLEINGISGGYTGPGFKTVIPYKAMAYLSCRLVPNQDPIKIAEYIIDHLKKRVPTALKFSYEILLRGSRGWNSSPHLPIVSILQEIYSNLYQTECRRIVMPATIPISPLLAQAAHTQPIICGISYLSDNVHAAEERFSIDQLRKGFLSICQLLDKLPS